jgi:acetyl esterase/lipase
MRISGLTPIALLAMALPLQAADAPPVLDLWPGKVPGEKGDIAPEKIDGKQGSRNLTNVSRPTLTIYRPAADRNTGVAVVIAPGGGYRLLAWDHEGEDVAAWLNSLGITGVLLKYRVPRRSDNPKAALQDAQRALSLVRSKADEWGLDPKRIGMVGFSAGGHLTAAAATNFDQRSYEPIDAADKVSCRPDFAIMVYPGGVVPAGSDKLAPEIRVTKETPPAFFAHAGNDMVSPENSVLMYLALKKAGVPAELHIYATGGHGFGMRKTKNPSAGWPQRCEEWLRSQGVLK